MAPKQTWRKSRRSQNGHNCVEVRSTLDQLRDSKNPAGPALPGDVPALLRAVQCGQFG